MNPDTFLHFWFDELEPRQWFASDPAFDQLLRDRFLTTLLAATAVELSEWRATPAGRLAEVMVLDQLSRNLFRGTTAAFANDPLALALAQEAITAGAPTALPPIRTAFLYLPFMHSESPAIQARSIELYTDLGLEQHLDFARKHKAIIDRFGRYPHRNAILGRTSTPEELAFIAKHGMGY